MPIIIPVRTTRHGALTGRDATSVFLATATADAHDQEQGVYGPPAKKRRVDTAAVIVNGDGDQLAEYVVVERMAIGLKHGASDGGVSVDGPRDRVPVALRHLVRVDDESSPADVIQLSSTSGATFLEIDLDETTPKTQALYDEVSTILNLARDITHELDVAAKAKRSRDAPYMTVRAHLSPIGEGDLLLEIEIACRPTDSVLHLPTAKVKRYLPLFERLFPARTEDSEPWSPQDYYECVHAPASTEWVPDAIQALSLNSTLYPFQERAVKWLLGREGVVFPSSDEPRVDEKGSLSQYPSYLAKTVREGDEIFYSRVQGRVLRDLNPIAGYSLDFRGGILSEEMGLGKTVELIALMTLNQRQTETETVFDEYTSSTVIPTHGTLIITPPSILEQWRSELANHAPHLKVFHYKGLPSRTRPQREHDEATVAHLRQFDVVLTTYSVLAREIHYAKPAPKRAFRHQKVHEPRRSPLVEMSWWRVCLDEAQMIESGVSQAAEVARLVPRCNAWAVTGTPFRKDVQDLLGLLLFLRYEPFCSSKEMWARIDKPTFRHIFGTIALRHTKDKIRHEIRLPPQRRVVITMPFTAIEEQYYSQLITEMCDACGVTADGAPASESWDPNAPALVEKMRTWLRRLRQTCLHPEVGGRNRRALGRSANAPMRTVGEVLEAMIEQNGTAMRAEERENINMRVLQGHVVAFAKDNIERGVRSKEIYLEALEHADAYVEECRKDYEMQLALAAESENASAGMDVDDGQTEAQFRLSGARNALRTALDVQHICAFFVGTSFFQIKTNEELTKPDSEEFHALEKSETEYYDRAKSIRREILHETQTNAQRAMKKLAVLRETTVPEVPELQELGGIEVRKAVERMDELKDVLDRQAAVMQEWREKVIRILLLPLVDEDDSKEITGDEYEDSTKAQDELYSYLAALRAIVADRTATLTGLKSDLIEHENKEHIRRAKNHEGHSPELMLELMAKRGELKVTESESIRSVVSQMRSMVTSLNWRGDTSGRAAHEIAIIEIHLRKVQEILSAQLKFMTEMEKDLELFRSTMNLRLDFYRQLQQISDTVAPYKEELDETFDQAAFDQAVAKKAQSDTRLGVLKTKQRFLLHLRQESSSTEQAKLCVICQSSFETGVLTVCGHQYCKECIRAWYRSHRNCPVCKRTLHSFDFHDITYRPQEIRAQEENHSPSKPASPAIVSNATSIYTDIGANTMKEIKSIELPGARSYGTKIDTISRHLLHIREQDPGAKSIIFSQYNDFLSVLQGALRYNKIGSAHIREADGIRRFRTDPSIECFLLDAKSDSSGLNLVNATYVFLCEPLINAALELQAIARVHRIGQQRETTVYMYLISDTVEEAIYDISVARRLAHLQRSRSRMKGRAAGVPELAGEAGPPQSSGASTPASSSSGTLLESALEAANSLELQQAPLSRLVQGGKSGGEVVEQGDLWSCLFGRPRRDKAVGVSNELRGEVARYLSAEAAQRRVAAAEETGP